MRLYFYEQSSYLLQPCFFLSRSSLLFFLRFDSLPNLLDLNIVKRSKNTWLKELSFCVKIKFYQGHLTKKKKNFIKDSFLFISLDGILMFLTLINLYSLNRV